MGLGVKQRYRHSRWYIIQSLGCDREAFVAHPIGDLRELLGVASRELEVALAALDADGAGLFALAEQMEERSLSFDAALQDLGALLHQIALAQTVPQALSEDIPERQRILDLAQRFSPEEVQLHYQITLHGRKDLGLAPDEFAGFSMALLRMLAFTLDAPTSGAQPTKHEAAPTRQAAKPVKPASLAPQPEAPPALKVQEPAPAPEMQTPRQPMWQQQANFSMATGRVW